MLVRVNSRHWARANQVGKIIDETEAGLRFCIEFEKKGIGIGGKMLWLDSKDFIYAERKTKSHAPKKGKASRTAVEAEQKRNSSDGSSQSVRSHSV